MSLKLCRKVKIIYTVNYKKAYMYVYLYVAVMIVQSPCGVQNITELHFHMNLEITKTHILCNKDEQ